MDRMRMGANAGGVEFADEWEGPTPLDACTYFMRLETASILLILSSCPNSRHTFPRMVRATICFSTSLVPS
jgi:hypothetical protein